MLKPEQAPNLVALFRAQAAAKGGAPFLFAKTDGRWSSLTWAEAAAQIDALAAALRTLGVAPGDRVVILSENRPEWLIADFAIMAAGAITVPAYTTNTAADHAHILTDSGARAAIVSTAKLARPLIEALAEAPACRDLIVMEPVAAPVAVQDWRTLLATTASPPPLATTRTDLACLIYTSGTGGRPKGVMQSHGALLADIAGCADIIEGDFAIGEDALLSFLPLSHALEHTAGQFLPVALGAEIHYAEGIDKLAANMAETRPTVMIVVPRLFEVLRQRIAREIEKQGGLPLRLLNRALAAADRRAAGRTTLLDRLLAPVIDRTLGAKVRARFGGRLKALVSGGAPLNPEVGRFFEALGLTVLQGYGLTETSPVLSCNRPSAGVAMDTVGPPIKGAEIRIAEDGEIMARGEMVMQGYWNLTQETARVLSPDGWLATGDIGRFDERGRLQITDRKKDIIVNDKGDNISPQRLEGLLTLEPEIAQAVVTGDRRPYLVALIVAEEGADAAAVQAALDRTNQRLGVTEKVRRFILADSPFTIENGQFTPSLKVRRHAVRAVYGDRLDALYRA
ncbi:AMP-dependent synthetase/ligase [Sphingomonas sp. ID0503]|uniref:AMP-dependent synthetase/ligase n=1 Tax=Sphingomonas sp. ID0503 TaxID=3399691 RepID=UPI003AFA70C6